MSIFLDNIEATQEGAPLRDLYLLDEIAHRILNDYTEAAAELRLAAASESGSSQLVLKSAATRLLARAQAHCALQAPKAGGKMELGGHLEQVCAAVSRARLAERGAWLALTADEVWLDADRCWLVGLIIAELINTFVRPGLPGETGAIPVRIVDGGWRMVGAVASPGGASIGDRKGRRLVEALSAELGGTLEWALTRHGGCAWFEFPIERSAGRR
jgi:two-component sensor histidine kinase